MCVHVYIYIYIYICVYTCVYHNAVLISNGTCATTTGSLELRDKGITSLALGVFDNMQGMT